jgi:hypothetical protein
MHSPHVPLGRGCSALPQRTERRSPVLRPRACTSGTTHGYRPWVPPMGTAFCPRVWAIRSSVVALQRDLECACGSAFLPFQDRLNLINTILCFSGQSFQTCLAQQDNLSSSLKTPAHRFLSRMCAVSGTNSRRDPQPHLLHSIVGCSSSASARHLQLAMATCQGLPNETEGTTAKDGRREGIAVYFGYCWVLTTETELSEIDLRIAVASHAILQRKDRIPTAGSKASMMPPLYP